MVISAVAWGQGRPIAPTDCDDTFAECKEDCAIKWGGTTNLKMRGKLTPCINKCSSIELDCRETFFETKRNNLDEGSISGSPSSRDSDSDGLPTKTAQKKPEEKKVERKEDDRRREEPAPKAEKQKEPAAKPAYELREEEVPKSNRSQISKVDDKGEKPPKAREEPPPRREEPKKATVGDSEQSPPPLAKKREEPKKDEKKKKALDEWDPDAL